MIEAMKQARDFISRLKFPDAEPEPEIVMGVLDKAIAELESQGPVAQPASEEDMKIYRAIADNYRKELTHPPQRTEQEPLPDFYITEQMADSIYKLKSPTWSLCISGNKAPTTHKTVPVFVGYVKTKPEVKHD